MVAKSARKSKRASVSHPPPKKTKGLSIQSLRDWQIFLVLAFISAFSRLPILKAFDLVTFDGTSYINQAKALLRGVVEGGAFPLGYLHLSPRFCP